MEANELSLEDQIAVLVTRLVSETENELYLKTLFSAHPAVWVKLSSHEVVTETMNGVKQLEEKLGGFLWACWLEYPDPEQAGGVCIISILFEPLVWTDTIFYNKHLFLTRSMYKKEA